MSTQVAIKIAEKEVHHRDANHLSTSNVANDGRESTSVKLKVNVAKCQNGSVAIERDVRIAVPVTSGLADNHRDRLILVVNGEFLGRRELGRLEKGLDAVNRHLDFAHSLHRNAS